MHNEKLMEEMRAFVVRTVGENDKTSRNEVTAAVEEYFSDGSFELSDHMDSYDFDRAVGYWMDDNASSIIEDCLKPRDLCDSIENYLSGSNVVEDTINDYDFDLPVAKFLESDAGKAVLADVILKMVLPKVAEVRNG
jgi:hypothetical protein